MLRVTPLALVSVVLLASCAPQSDGANPPAPGPAGKGEVSREDLLGAHICRTTGGRDATFRWEFRDTEFTIARGAGPIPPDVLAAVAGRSDDAARIDGRWKLHSGSLVLTGLHARTDDDRTEPAPDVTLAPFRTPVVRFELGGTQYVLGQAE